MKTIIAFAFIVALVAAELPPSNSYLPPPPNSRGSAGYPQGPASLSSQNIGPQIVAARNFDSIGGSHAGLAHGRSGSDISHDKPFGRSSHASQGYAARSQPATGYDGKAASFARNALEEINAEPANYNFGYMVNDYQEGTDFGHHEARQEERTQGEYHVVLPDGRKQTVSYEADERGFKPQISYEESENLARSGYNGNANNFRSGTQTPGNFGQHGNTGRDGIGARNSGY